MNLRSIILVTLSCVVVLVQSKNYVLEAEDKDVGEPVFLTPYIEEGLITEAKEAAKISLRPFNEINSYSGFFTVNKTFNKNLFSWFIPSKNKDDPVMLWLQGGPGVSSLFGLFMEIGPYKIENNEAVLRNYSWTETHSILFIDNPVGTGFSFTDEGGLSHNEYQIGIELYEALRQFFLLFPEYRKNDFFVTGESYAGKYVPVISHVIFRNNEHLSDCLKINLKGLAIGNAWLDPVNQMNIGEYAFQHGLVDKRTKKVMDELRNESIKLLQQKKFVASTLEQRKITTVFKNASGFESMYNYLHPTNQKTGSVFKTFVQKPEVRKAIHVGNLTLNPDEPVDTALLGDIMVSVADLLEELLENFRVLIYSGQLDVAVPYPTTVNYLEKLKFSAADTYKIAKRNIWYKNDQIAGYAKEAGNLIDLMVSNAGHLVPADQPEVAYEMIHRFTRKKKIS